MLVAERRRVRLRVRGAVQGVGFRPFVYRLAGELGVVGWVGNDTAGVIIEAEADAEALERFRERLQHGAPAQARITAVEADWVAACGEDYFAIRPSEDHGAPTALVQPDLATCPECLRELGAGADRRFGYAFTNCTHCGPRFSIIRALPYDRPLTTMADFVLCPSCSTEYRNPADRRFHAQPNACPACGPHLELMDGAGVPASGVDTDRAAVAAAALAIGRGRIVAVKGIGGFLLLCDAADEAAVARLRARKTRPTKPFAVMVGDLAGARELVEVDATAQALLESAAAPIVLLPRRVGAPLASEVAPGNPYLGVMLPYAPLLHLLMQQLAGPVVATSGNLSEEPICTDNGEALARLGGIADLFLLHDRPIERHVDDSVAVVIEHEARLMRRARGYAPLPVTLPEPAPDLAAVGAHMKCVLAVSRGRDVFLSQHIGDLETLAAQQAFDRVLADLLRFYRVVPAAIAHDMHPDYVSTARASTLAVQLTGGPRLIGVQHHHAHLASCLAEHGGGRALGVIWDGTGYGTDATIWGGEFLLGDAAGYHRVAHLRPFMLPGGDSAAREPERVALALLGQLRAQGVDTHAPLLERMPAGRRRLLEQMVAGGVNAPRSSSMGRLFDGVAALIGLGGDVTFEGEAAMRLEFAADPTENVAYPLPLDEHAQLDWRHLLEELLLDQRRGLSTARMAARFHNGLVEAAAAVAGYAGERRVALSGGCFQNRLLTERVARVLRARGHEVLLHREVPPNDGGIALGQIAVAAAALAGQGG